MANLQYELKCALDGAEAIINGKESPSDEQIAEYKTLIAKAEKLKEAIDAKTKAETLKAWAEAPDGQSVVKAAFSREAMPDEGNSVEVSADPRTGEIYALGGVGEETLKHLKSGSYKDAVVDYIKSTGLGRPAKKSTMGELNWAMKVLNEGTDTAGGFWVPPDFRTELVKKMVAMTSVRQNAYSFTTGSDLVKFPKVTYTADNLYASGVRFNWQAALIGSDITEATNPVAGQVTIPVHLATAAIIVARSQLEDNQFDLMGYLSQNLAEAFALGEESAFTTGDGAGKPWGFLSHTNASVASSGGGMYITSGTSAKIDWGYVTAASGTPAKGILGVEAALPPQYENGAKWMANKSVYANIRAFTDTTGRPLWTEATQFPNFTTGRPASLLGYETLKNQFMPSIGADALVLALGDFQGYYIADRVGLGIEVFREVQGLRDNVVIYARKRVGGQLVHDWKVKLLKLAS